MTQPATSTPKLHSRNKHNAGYDFDILCTAHEALKQYVFRNKFNTLTIDFANANAVLNLNCALLKAYYGVTFWEFPKGYLCPPIPGRADYIHYLADLLKETNNNKIPHKQTIKALDIGTGANCIYPIIGASQYEWDFVGSDINTESINSAQKIVEQNNCLSNHVTIIKQPDEQYIFNNIIQPNDIFDITLCNPPFHRSANDALSGTERKWKNLNKNTRQQKESSSNLNFGGKNNELWCEGGELAFIKKMINESKRYKSQVLWFTSLVSKKEHVKALQLALKKAKCNNVKVIKMEQGQKISRFIAWSFLSNQEKQLWCETRFS